MGRINGFSGATIRTSLSEALGEVAGQVRVIAGDDTMPVEARNRRRLDAMAAAQVHINEAQAALDAWASETEMAARAALAKRPIGSAAEESRRVADELRVGRLVDNARASGTPGIAAKELAAQASAAYVDASDPDGYREAIVLAQAAVELGGPGLAGEVLDAASRQLETPEQRRARADLREVEMERLAFTRDANAAVSGALSEAARAAEATGDQQSALSYRRGAAQASMTSKMLAFKIAQETEQPYAEPAGVLASRPTGEHRLTDGEVDRLTTTIR